MMQPVGWVYHDERRDVWQHKCWDNGPKVLGEYATKGDAVRASYGFKETDVRTYRKEA